MKRFGLIGNPVNHSFSPTIFGRIFAENNITDATYSLFLLQTIHDLPNLLKENPDLGGFNVTIPYKSTIFPYLDYISDEAATVGSVNTVVINKGKLNGYNTDVIGFRKSISQLNVTNRKALIFGTGGSALAVKAVLKSMGIDYATVSRSSGISDFVYGELDANTISKHKLIINCSPVGMHPEINTILPIPMEAIGKNHICIDLIYNPEKTKFLQLAEEQGAFIKNGMEMLQFQAEAAWDLFNLQHQ